MPWCLRAEIFSGPHPRRLVDGTGRATGRTICRVLLQETESNRPLRFSARRSIVRSKTLIIAANTLRIFSLLVAALERSRPATRRVFRVMPASTRLLMAPLRRPPASTAPLASFPQLALKPALLSVPRALTPMDYPNAAHAALAPTALLPA